MSKAQLLLLFSLQVILCSLTHVTSYNSSKTETDTKPLAVNDCCSDNRGSCTPENKEHPSWNWDLNDTHPCNIRRMSKEQFQNEFESSDGLLPLLYHEPIVLHSYRPDDDEFKLLSSLENITNFFPTGFLVTLSSSNSFSSFRQTIPLTQYINEMLSTEVYPHDLSNETWYFFGQTYSSEWKEFLGSYPLPPCQACTKDLSALSFGIGNRGSGVQWHFHGPGFSETIHGRKHWVLYSPDQKPDYDPNYASRHWMEYAYSSSLLPSPPRECTIHAGEMIYFPDGWHHVSTFTRDRDAAIFL